MADLDSVSTCLSGTLIAFITQEAAKLTERMAAIVTSFTDPMEMLAETNVQQLVNGVSSLGEGDVSGKLASVGAYIVVTRVKRELNNVLKEVIQQNPGIGNMIQRIANVSEAVYGIISLAIMMRKEAPYSAVKIVIDDINDLLDAKETNLNQLKQHIIQLNNTLMSTTDNPKTTSELLKQDFQSASDLLNEASTSLLTLQSRLEAAPSEYVEKYYNEAKSSIDEARSLVSPQTETNVLDVASAFSQASVGTKFLTNSQLKLASYSIMPLTLQIECELTAILRQTDRINNFIEFLPAAVPNYESAVESVAMKDFRVKLVRQIRLRIESLKSDIDNALSQESLDRLALQALSWTSRLNAITEMLPKVQNRIESTMTSEQQARIDQMAAELDRMLEAIGDINSTNVVSGFESTVGLESQVRTIIGSAKTLGQILGTGSMDVYSISSFRQTVSEVVFGSDSSIQESLDTISALRSALAFYQTLPPEDQRIEQLLNLLELLGFDRAKDLLKAGKFKEMLNTTMDDASYIGLAIKCLIDAENVLEDTITLSLVTGLRETLEGQRISELSAAFDIIDSGKNAAILDVKDRLAEGQETLATVRRIMETVKALGLKTGRAVSEISRAAEGLEEHLGEVLTSVGGDLNETLAGLDIDGLQGGCMGQLKH